VGACFFALAAYIAIDASVDLLKHEASRVTYLGIILLTLIRTDICAYLSVILLLGLALNAVLGWWWVDPIAALCMPPIIIREGIAGWCGKTCSHAHF
jgi:hypothetical protein